jgi:ribosomal protein S18 acetylase RimI-like enzyme
MSSLRRRELREEDAEAVARLFAETFGGARSIDAAEIRTWLRNGEFESDWLCVLEDGGRVVGYGDIWPQGDVLELDAAAPRHWETLFDWAEQEARKRGTPRVRVQSPHGHALAEVARGRGYAPWRHSLTMEIELAEPPPVGLPDGFRLDPYRDADAEPLRSALNEAFAADPFWRELSASGFREFYLGGRGFDPRLWLLARAGAELAGFALSYPVRGSDTELGWVGTLGVRTAWRRRGLGEALLRSALGVLYARGLRRVGLGVDAENVTGARQLYERAGMRQVRRSDSWVKDL